MHFGQPIWLLIGLAAVILTMVFFHRTERRRRTVLQQFAAGHLLGQLTASVSLRLRSFKRWMLAAAVFLLFATLARPQYGTRWEEVKRKGIDILFAVDVSRSMLAQDVSPNRLTRAKLGVLDFLARLEGDRVGLIAFAGGAFLQCPMTLDYDAFRQSLEALDTSVIPRGGTDVASAIREAVTAFQTAARNHKLLVLLSDGEDLEGQAVVEARKAAEAGLRIFTVGVGTPAGEMIPVTTDGGGTDFVKDEKGNIVKSHLDESTLRQIAENTGGFYVPLGPRGEGLEAVYSRGLAALPRQDLSSRMHSIHIERFEWSLALAILILVVEMLMGERKSGFRFQVPRLRFWRKAARTVPLLGFLLLVPAASASVGGAEKAYRQGKFPEAVKQYRAAVEKNPRRPELNYNLGAAEYRSGQFTDAAGAFQRSLQTDRLPLQQQAFYNLGNAQYRIGQQTEKPNPQQTIQAWQQALQSYQGALKLKPDDADAKFNYEFVKKKLEELQKQQEQQQQDQQQQNKQDQNKTDPKNQPKPNQKEQNSSGQNKPDQKNPSQNQKNPDKGENTNEKNPSSPRDENPDQQRAGNQPRPMPGQMTQEEAKSLLDSVKDDEKKMPLAPLQEGGGTPPEPKRDW
jgi:Ca-activated chloride channel family protein